MLEARLCLYDSRGCMHLPILFLFSGACTFVVQSVEEFCCLKPVATTPTHRPLLLPANFTESPPPPPRGVGGWGGSGPDPPPRGGPGGPPWVWFFSAPKAPEENFHWKSLFTGPAEGRTRAPPPTGGLRQGRVGSGPDPPPGGSKKKPGVHVLPILLILGS